MIQLITIRLIEVNVVAKRQICVQVDEDVAKKMEKIRNLTGIPVSRQIELKLKGFKIVKDEESTTEIDSKTSAILKYSTNDQ